MFQDISNEMLDEDAELFPDISPIILNQCMKLSVIKNNKKWVDSIRVAGELVKDTLESTAEDMLYASIVYKLVTIINDISHGSDIEDTFVHNFAHSILSSMFSCDRYFQQEWANCGLEAEKSYKPDWIASVKPWKTKFNIVIAEIKPPSKKNRGIISDFAKLGREMKLMLDMMIKAGLEEATSFGMLMGGNTLTLYMMDLKAPGIYRLIEIDQLVMVTEFKDFMQFPRTLPILYRFKEKALGVAKSVETLELSKSRGEVIRPPLTTTWLRASADAKIKIIKD